MKIRWYDWLVYRLFYWRWSKILASSPAHRELMISYLKAYDTVDVGEKVKITIEKVK